MNSYTRLCDADLMLLLKGGDNSAYTEIYERYHSLLYIYAHRKLQNKHEAQDIVQEVLLNLWNKRSAYTEKLSLTSYLFTAVRNRAFDLFAHRKVADKYLSSLQDFMTAANSTDFLVRENDLKRLIDKEIQSLPERMRQIFLLSRQERLTNKEIAELLKLSPHTIDTQIKRALKVLKARLGPYFWILYFFY